MWKWKVIIIALLMVAYGANGLFMIVDPALWYVTIDGVTDTGPYNTHFLRDIGLIYGTLAVSLALALSFRRMLYPLTLIPFIWVGLHALLHVWDIFAGRLPVEHWMLDLPGVFAPAIVHGFLSWWVKPDWEASFN